MKILIVDDEKFVLNSLKRNIKTFDSSIVVDISDSVTEALENVSKTTYDCILSDLNMPNQDGLSLIRTLKKNHIPTPLIIMTGCPKTESAVECLKTGAADFISKPFSAESLIEKVKDLNNFDNAWSEGYKLKDYHLKELISETPSSLVFKAVKKGSDDILALKTLKAESLVKSKTVYLRFQREIETLQKADHPNIVKILDFGLSRLEMPFLVMPFIEGQTLSNLIDHLSPNKFIQVMIKVCEALAYLHSKNLVHRDIKPGNIIIQPNGEPLLIDFGIILVKDDIQLTKEGVIVGTPNYMAPEAFSNSHIVKAQADIYSIGTILYRYAYKKCPYESDGVYGIIKNIIKVKDEEIFEGSPFDDLIKKLIKKNAGERVDSVLYIIEELKKILKTTAEKF